MVRYGLAKVLRGVKARQTQKSANGLENVLLQGLGSRSENFKAKIFVVVLVT